MNDPADVNTKPDIVTVIEYVCGSATEPRILEKLWVLGDARLAILTLRAQRAELLAALQKIAEIANGAYVSHRLSEIEVIALDAIARAGEAS